MPGLFCATGALKDGWLTVPGRAGTSRLPYAHCNLTLHNRHTLHVRVPGGTRSVGSPSLSLCQCPSPPPDFHEYHPRILSLQIISLNSVRPGSEAENEVSESWGGRERERPIPCMFVFCSSPDTFGSFPPKDLCTHCALSRSSLISNIFPHQGPSTPLLTRPVPPAQSPGPALFLCVAFLPLRAFFFFVTWNPIICCDYLFPELLFPKRG